MKVIILLCVFSFLLADSLSAKEKPLARVNYQGKYGFIDRRGDFVIQPQYDYVLSFKEGRAAVEIGGKYGFIDVEGNLIVGFQFEDANWFWEGLASVKKDDKYGFIDRTGRLIIDYRFDETFDFSEGLADVKIGDRCGYIDSLGNTAIPIKYETCYRFNSGTAVVEGVDLIKYLINKKGEIIESGTKVDPLSRANPPYQPFWDDEAKARWIQNSRREDNLKTDLSSDRRISRRPFDCEAQRKMGCHRKIRQIHFTADLR